MKAKVILLLIVLSLSLMHESVFAVGKKGMAKEREGVSQKTEWIRRGDVPRKPDDGYYLVRKGDTLWDISNSFLRDPFRWADLWKTNAYIINPHLIYPGNKIRLFPEIEVTPTVPEGLTVEKLKKPEEEVAPVPVPAEEKPTEEVKAPSVETKPVPEAVKISSLLMQRNGFISTKELEGVGVIIAARDEKQLLSKGDIVFISVAQGSEVKPGDKFTIFTTAGKVKHPVTGDTMGFLTDTIGMLEVIKIEEGGAIAARIEKSYKEILKEAKLKPYDPPVTEIAVRKSEKAIEGFIIVGMEGKVGSAENDVVYLDGGRNVGLEKGYVMSIFRPTPPVEDPMSGETIILPAKDLGSLVIIAVEDDTATAFVTKSFDAIYKGDRVRTE